MSKNETVKIKGFAILLMMWHHLFGCGTFLVSESNTWLGSDFDYIIGRSGKICIALFVVLSGYGLYKSYITKNTGRGGIPKRILSFCISYWVIMFGVAIPYLIYKDSFEISTLPLNLFALVHDDGILYVSFSWYVKLHILFLCVLPIIRLIETKYHTIIAHGAVFCSIELLGIMGALIFNDKTSITGFIADSIFLLCKYLPLFYIGIISAKYRLYETILEHVKIEDSKKVFSGIVDLILLICILVIRSHATFRNGQLTDMIYVPLFIFVALHFIRVSCKWTIIHKVLFFLGKNSFQYWLLSGMFFLNTVELQWILFIPQYSVLVFIWTFIILTPGVLVCSNISSTINNMIFKQN